MDLGVFQKTKVTKEIYTQESSWYKVVVSEAPSVQSEGVTMFYQPEGHFSVEAIRICGVNVVSFYMALGGRKWFIVGCYLAPDDTSTIYEVFADISQRPQGSALLVVVYFITDLVVKEGRARDEYIAAAMS